MTMANSTMTTSTLRSEPGRGSSFDFVITVSFLRVARQAHPGWQNDYLTSGAVSNV